ncbi:MAG: hypothetical protein JOZ62_03745 [Acidobacteriaceae bacterium]|nr:hypothetical protein [Acidobacteriaceae bacterium]
MQATFRCAAAILALSSARAALFGQVADAPVEPVSDVARQMPLVTGAFGFLTDLQSQHQQFGPKFEPILLLPFANRFLIETEYSTELPVVRDDGRLGPALLNHSVEYMQLDYSATSWLTVVGGYFVTPFGIYKERIDPLWIRNLIDVPLLFPVNDNSSNGVMARGAFFVQPWVKVNYAASFSAAVGNSQFTSQRQSSDRVGLVFPKQRLEIGASYTRVFNPVAHYDVHGFDISWKPKQAPAEFRGEGVWSNQLGSGFWIEGAYRFSSSKYRFLRKSQIVARPEHYSPSLVAADINPDLPVNRTNRLTFGWNYWFGDYLRANVAYAREWQAGVPGNVVTLGLVYRFTLPGEIVR